MRKKRCIKCKTLKSISGFKKHSGRRDGFYEQCKVCVKEYRSTPRYKIMALEAQRKWRARNPHKCKEWSKKFRESDYGKKWIFNDSLKRNYGISSDDYDRMISMQKGRCAICNVHESKLSRRLHVDHCHETNLIRGLLCHGCNTSIGSMKKVSNLKNAIQYLTIHSGE